MKKRELVILPVNNHWMPVYFVDTISPTKISLVEKNERYTRSLCIASVEFWKELTDEAIMLNSVNDFVNENYEPYYDKRRPENGKGKGKEAKA